jgi:hypothetical protein
MRRPFTEGETRARGLARRRLAREAVWIYAGKNLIGGSMAEFAIKTLEL